MQDINSIIGRSGLFILPDDDEIEGYLAYDDNKRVFLHSRINRNQYIKYSEEEIQISGRILGLDITLLRVILICTTTSGLLDGDEDNSIHADFRPTAIIGNKKYINSIFVDEINSCAVGLGKMIPLETECEFMQEGKYNPHIRILEEPKLFAKDEHGCIRIYSQLGLGNKDYLPYFTRQVRFSYCFETPTELTKAYKELYCCRNLFSLFMDDCLNMNDYAFTDIENEECNLIDNYNYETETKKELPIISWQYIKNDFQTIWEKWKMFLEKNDEAMMLFYEILSDDSIRINRFLNLCQIVEIISRNERNHQAKAIREECKKTFDKEFAEKNRRYKLSLKHRILDAIRYSDILDKKVNNGIDYYIASEISELRNYYTHYDNKRLKIDRNESINHIYYFSLFMRCVVLKSIFKYLGIVTTDLFLSIDYKYAIEATYKIGKRKLESSSKS